MYSITDLTFFRDPSLICLYIHNDKLFLCFDALNALIYSLSYFLHRPSLWSAILNPFSGTVYEPCSLLLLDGFIQLNTLSERETAFFNSTIAACRSFLSLMPLQHPSNFTPLWFGFLCGFCIDSEEGTAVTPLRPDANYRSWFGENSSDQRP